MILQMAEIVGLLQQGVARLLREAGVGMDAVGDGRGSATPGRERPSAAPGSSPSPVGQGEGLRRGGGSECADPENTAAAQREPRTAPGELGVVPAQRASGGSGWGQDDAGG